MAGKIKDNEMAQKPDKTKVKNWLKNKGHNSASVEAKKWDTEPERIQSLRELHGVSEAEYEAGKKPA